jgi:HEPN domain-containing protein
MITSEQEFRHFMEEVDEELRRLGVEIPGRPIYAMSIITERLKITLRLVPDREPIPARYDGDDFSIRIIRWFQERYGDRLKKRWGPGESFVVIRGDAYRVHLLRIWGRRRLICDPATHGMPYDCMRGETFNILESIEAMTPAFSRTLALGEKSYLLERVTAAQIRFQHIEQLYGIGFGPQAKTDFTASVESVMITKPDYGASRWHSLQAAEKFLKTYLGKKQVRYPKSHDLLNLAKLVRTAGGPAIAESDLVRANVTAAVRYGEVKSSLVQAADAHDAATIICAIIAKEFPR